MISISQYIILGNFIAGVLAIFFYVFLLFNQTFGKNLIRHFTHFTMIFFFLAIFDSLDIWARTSTGADWAQPLRYVTISMGYFLRATSLVFIGHILHPSMKKIALYYYIALVIEAVLLIVNIFYHWIFAIEGTKFIRGYLNWLVYLIDAYCLIVTLVVVILHARISSTPLELTVIFLMGAAVVAAVVLEVIYGVSLILNAAALAIIIFYYLFLQVNAMRVDDLTHLFNRKTWNQHVADKYMKKECVIVCCDMNGLKKLNDSQGHAAGDKGIASFANAFRSCKLPKSTCYRVGGDEFVIMSFEPMDEVEQMMIRVSSVYQNMGYSISYGICKYEYARTERHLYDNHPEDNFMEAYKKADDLMYEMKREMHLRREDMEKAAAK